MRVVAGRLDRNVRGRLAGREEVALDRPLRTGPESLLAVEGALVIAKRDVASMRRPWQ